MNDLSTLPTLTLPSMRYVTVGQLPQIPMLKRVTQRFGTLVSRRTQRFGSPIQTSSSPAQVAPDEVQPNKGTMKFSGDAQAWVRESISNLKLQPPSMEVRTAERPRASKVSWLVIAAVLVAAAVVWTAALW